MEKTEKIIKEYMKCNYPDFNFTLEPDLTFDQMTMTVFPKTIKASYHTLPVQNHDEKYLFGIVDHLVQNILCYERERNEKNNSEK